MRTPLDDTFFAPAGLVLPRLTPQPPLLPGGEERGSEQPQLVLSLRLGHQGSLFLCVQRCGRFASRRLAGVTKSNVDLAPLSRPVGRERGWGRGWGKRSPSEGKHISPIGL